MGCLKSHFGCRHLQFGCPTGSLKGAVFQPNERLSCPDRVALPHKDFPDKPRLRSADHALRRHLQNALSLNGHRQRNPKEDSGANGCHAEPDEHGTTPHRLHLRDFRSESAEETRHRNAKRSHPGDNEDPAQSLQAKRAQNPFHHAAHGQEHDAKVPHAQRPVRRKKERPGLPGPVGSDENQTPDHLLQVGKRSLPEPRFPNQV